MKSQIEYLKNAEENNWAIGHFNFAQLEALRAIVKSAKNLNAPIYAATSEGERTYIGLKEAVFAIRAFREEFNLPIWLNADHTKSFQAVKEAVNAGYDAILADFSHLSFEENLKLTKQSVEYAKSKNPEIIVEGELGLLRGESKIQEEIKVKPEDLADPEQSAYFVKETRVDMLAPALGNIHGIIKGEEKLDFERIKKIKESVGKNVFLVLHGASGIKNEDLEKAIKNGVSIIHINTEIRVAFTEAMEKSIKDHPKETTPYKILAPAIDAMQKVIEEKLKVFGSVNRV